MKCNQCEKELPEGSVFCLYCGAPLKSTADYDYIKDEIGANVDKIKTGDGESKDHSLSKADKNDDFSKTRNIFGKDTVFDEDDKKRRETAKSKDKKNDSRNLREAYEDDYYDDDYDDDYEYIEYEDDYDDWGIEDKGGNGKTVLTTVIIALICLLGIAAIIYFGLRPQDKNKINDVITAFNADNIEINEGDEFAGEVSISLVSNEGYDIRYTTDGSDVDINSTLYIGPVLVDEEGVFQLKAMSFDEKGNPSGEGLARAITILKQAETTTEAPSESETEAVVSQEEAEKIAENALIENGAMNEDYLTEDGGFINLIHAGETDIEGLTYYIVQADYYDAEGAIWETTYYGVDTQAGTLSYLNKTDDGYVIVE